MNGPGNFSCIPGGGIIDDYAFHQHPPEKEFTIINELRRRREIKNI
jgi:hypothetical protein